MSDKVFKGNRGATGVFFMMLVTIATVVFWLNPPGNPSVDMACMITIGFLIYGPVMLIGLHALEHRKKQPVPPPDSPDYSAISAVLWQQVPSSALPWIISAGTAVSV